MGGQKARVVFVELSLLEPHILMLDEPTNNLDIESIEALCESLCNFNGGVLLISHDARLIGETNCRIWIVGENQNVRVFPGEFDDYKEELLNKMEEAMRKEDEKQMERRKEKIDNLKRRQKKSGK